ncbi:MAG: FeoB-associated Cys-rich membrane protein [Clostridia bacterium]|nr:FeoB-associated Cys-rich membrane protein [Clostridia bacterium]
MNAPTIIVLLIVALLFAFVLTKEIKKRKSGKGGCACGCSGCAMKGVCHGDE